jgi:hypothetical protein
MLQQSVPCAPFRKDLSRFPGLELGLWRRILDRHDLHIAADFGNAAEASGMHLGQRLIFGHCPAWAVMDEQESGNTGFCSNSTGLAG